jgi:hypothetical protein
MADIDERPQEVMINRAPVLTLWASVVAECLGFDREEALTLGRAVAGLNAYSKGVALGLFQPTPIALREQRQKMRGQETVAVDLLNRAVLATCTEKGLRALSNNRPIRPESVQKYLESKFGDALDDAYTAMMELAGSLAPPRLAQMAYGLYERFRPEVPHGRRGWGTAGRLELDKIREMARET